MASPGFYASRSCIFRPSCGGGLYSRQTDPNPRIHAFASARMTCTARPRPPLTPNGWISLDGRRTCGCVVLITSHGTSKRSMRHIEIRPV